MEITEIRIKLLDDRREKLQAFCTVTVDDCFVIRDLKIIEGQKGPFVAMPSRKLTDRCPKCGGKNHLRARHCNDCGERLDMNRALRDDRGRARLHTDIAHPINSECREQMQRAILRAFTDEVKRSKLPGYKPADLGADYDEYDDYSYEDSVISSSSGNEGRSELPSYPRPRGPSRHQPRESTMEEGLAE
ncbi:MAG: SpoVG family protein [Planctomycetota bacterium]